MTPLRSQTVAWVLMLVVACAAPVAKGASPANPVDFDSQVMPVFTLAGCNAGSCHGSATGRGGFKLSLLGSSPAEDYRVIVRELEGRRVNLVKPELSLLLRKPTEAIDHEGGYKVKRGSEAEKLLVSWIGQGVPRTLSRKLERLDISPADALVQQPDGRVNLIATARFADGTSEDVTRWTLWTPNDDAAVVVTRDGEATVKRRGEHVVLARFLDRVEAVTLSLPLRDEPIESTLSPVANFIDRHVNEKLTTLRIPPSPQTEDAAFLRRVRLDLTGSLPTPEEIRAFTSDTRPDKRAAKIEELLQSASHADYWAMKLADYFQVDSAKLGAEGARAFHAWLRERVEKNTPLDRVAGELLTATGDSFSVGPANFSRVQRDARGQAEYVSRVFMGVRLGCANCHNHPLDRWTQDDYHGLAAAFAKVGRGRIVGIESRGEVTHPVTGAPATARLPGVRFLRDDEQGPTQVAAWLTDPANPYFARAMVNRIWRQLMGRGLVEPMDDVRATNPPTHPKLLDELTADFVAHGCDARRTIRLIVQSATYQRDSRTLPDNNSDDRFYSHSLFKPLDAPVIADAMGQATGVWESYTNMPEGTRAVTLFDSRTVSRSLDVLGRCSRDEPCDSSVAGGGDIGRTLHLINGELINRKITSPRGRLHTMLDQGKAGRHTVTELYLLTLSREPTAGELEQWLKQTDNGRDAQAMEDLFWALLSCREFLTNH